MADSRVWLITGAGRGMGVDLAQAALAAGYRAVATARDAAQVSSRRWRRLPICSPSLRHLPRRRLDRLGGGCCDQPGLGLLHRRAREQRGELPARILRGDQSGAVPCADGDELLRSLDRHPVGPADHARLRSGHIVDDHLNGRYRLRVRRAPSRRLEVRPRRVDRVAARMKWSSSASGSPPSNRASSAPSCA